MERAERLERDDTPDGNVDVLCDFTVEYGEWSMGLRVATDDATYIVKNISDFAAASMRARFSSMERSSHSPTCLRVSRSAVAR